MILPDSFPELGPPVYRNHDLPSCMELDSCLAFPLLSSPATRDLYPSLFLLCACAPILGQSGNVVITANTRWVTGTYNLTSLTVQGGAVLTIGGGSTVTVTGALVVTGNSRSCCSLNKPRR